MIEHADAVVVGARCAGSATAIALARAGRRVIALDRIAFPADTISTHLLFPSGVAEIARLGALDRVRALGAPELHTALVGGETGGEPHARFTPIDGIDHGMCVRRPGLDAALVETARAAGAEVRENVRVTDLVWEGSRVAGVRGEDFEIRAPLVVGADGRRSTVARLVGTTEPYRSNPNGRACYFAYFTDPPVERRLHAGSDADRPDWRTIAAQWRTGAELGTAFPCDDGLLLVLLMPPVERIDDFRADLQAEFERTIRRIPGLSRRLASCDLATKVRSATDTTSYFRRSSGLGWALPGDAGHFKDPVTAQGIRDALRFGRLLGEAAAPVLEDPLKLYGALHDWERRRERECLETYQWTNILGRAESMTPLELELYRSLERSPAMTRELLDVFSRVRPPSDAFGARRVLGLAVKALARRRPGTLATLRRDAAVALRDRRELRAALRHPLPSVPGVPVRDADRFERDRAVAW